MKKFLIVIDIQNDFVDGALGTPEAMQIVANASAKIEGFEGDIIATFDTHCNNYLQTAEGAKLPVPHCIKGTHGWQLNSSIAEALNKKGFIALEKPTFGSVELPRVISEICGDEELSIELIGLCTDICVVCNALILKANFPEATITVDSSCCAGVTPTTHNAALDTMRCCQINVI